jgi:hypothetical protein
MCHKQGKKWKTVYHHMASRLLEDIKCNIRCRGMLHQLDRENLEKNSADVNTRQILESPGITMITEKW